MWNNCYDDSWKDVIVPEAFAHPAKMAYGLLKRILAHAAAEGWIQPGGVIVDPFGGIGSTGILGAYEGYQVVCCELEAKFKALAEQNFKLHAHKWDVLGCPQPVILQGDSRKLCEVVEKADIIVSSPPYEGLGVDTKGHGIKGAKGSIGHGCQADKAEYGQTPGQLGAMKPGSVDSIISSPPYAESLQNDGQHRANFDDGRDRNKESSWQGMKYGPSKGNLGNLKPGSVEAIVNKGLTDNTASAIVKGKKESTDANSERATERRQRKAAQRSDAKMDEAEAGNRVSLLQTGHEPKPNRGVLSSNAGHNLEDDESAGPKTVIEGQAAGQRPLQLQGREKQHIVPEVDKQGKVPEVRDDGESGDSSQEQRPLRRQPEQSGSPLQFVSSEDNETEMVGGKEGGQADAQEQRPARLEASLIVSSPPYEGSDVSSDGQRGIDGGMKDMEVIQEKRRRGRLNTPDGYGQTDGNIGNDKGDTFWQAAAEIVQQCHQILKPGGHAIWVVKSFVRKGKIVDFPGDWQRLCESAGFETVCVHHAMLVKETKEDGLFGQEIIERKERKSFFRRLSDRKAAENGYWASLSLIQQGVWIEYAHEKSWEHYNSLTDAEKAERMTDLEGEPLKYPPPEVKSILSSAKSYALEIDADDPNDWNEHVRIDYEVVICCERPTAPPAS